MKTFVFGALAFCFLADMIGAAQTAEPFLLKPLDHGAWAAIDNPAAKYGDWAFFAFAVPDIQRTDEELRGVKRLPQ